MSTMIDMIGAYVFGCVLLLTAARLNLYMTSTQQQSTLDGIAQQNCVQLGELIENDVYKAGYNVPPGSFPIFKYAGPDSLCFISDIDGIDSVVQVIYSTAPKPGSPNPHQKYFRRSVYGKAQNINLGLTNLQFTYYDSSGEATSVLANIRAVNVCLDVESDYRSATAGGKATRDDLLMASSASSDSVFNGVRWRQYIVPKRLHF